MTSVPGFPSRRTRIRAVAGLTLLLLALATALVLAAALAGCSLFEPRDPERPSSTPTARCRTRSSPDSVAAIIQESYGTTSGVTCYESALDAGFIFHPDPVDSINDPDPNIYAGWNRDVERRVATNLASAGFAVAVLDSEYAVRYVSPDNGTQVRYYAYHLLFQPKSGGPEVRYQGLADLTMRQGPDAHWAITVWVDKQDGSANPTWGRLRRNYRVGF
jgi:hypothetical protein